MPTAGSHPRCPAGQPQGVTLPFHPPPSDPRAVPASPIAPCHHVDRLCLLLSPECHTSPRSVSSSSLLSTGSLPRAPSSACGRRHVTPAFLPAPPVTGFSPSPGAASPHSPRPLWHSFTESPPATPCPSLTQPEPPFLSLLTPFVPTAAASHSPFPSAARRLYSPSLPVAGGRWPLRCSPGCLCLGCPRRLCRAAAPYNRRG